MALNIAVPLSAVDDLSPVSPIGLERWENLKLLVSPIGSESSGVSSLDFEEPKQGNMNQLNHHQSTAHDSSKQIYSLELQSPPKIIKNQNENFANMINHNISNKQENNNNSHNSVKKPQDLKIMYNGRDILDLGKNIETNPKLWNLNYTYLPENNNIPMFLANRSQYHRLGANGHVQDYTLYHCDHCDFQFPVNCNNNYFCQTSLNVTLPITSSALYTTSSLSKDSLKPSTCSITPSSTSSIISSRITQDIAKNNSIASKNNSKKLQMTKEQLNNCDFSYNLKKVLVDYNNSNSNEIQNFMPKCNNINNSQIPTIFSHSVAAVAAAAALSPQLSSQATSPSCCSSSGYSSNGSTSSLFCGPQGNNGIRYPLASIANGQPNFNKNSALHLQQQQKINFNKSGGDTFNNNNSFYSIQNSVNNSNGNNVNCNNYWNNSNGISFGANNNFNQSNTNLMTNNGGNHQNFQSMYKYF